MVLSAVDARMASAACGDYVLINGHGSNHWMQVSDSGNPLVSGHPGSLPIKPPCHGPECGGSDEPLKLAHEGTAPESKSPPFAVMSPVQEDGDDFLPYGISHGSQVFRPLMITSIWRPPQ